jgi:hypothetical protein
VLKPWKRSELDRLFRKLLIYNAPGGSTTRMLVKGWPSSILNAAIANILITEVLDFSPPELCTTPEGYTAKSFEYLSEMDDQPAVADIDMELWPSSSIEEHNRHVGNYTNAGPTFSYARSGIFLRPGGDVAARKLVIESGSSYRNLVRDILPMLPTLGQVRDESGPLRDLVWCGIGDDEHCFESPNRDCLDDFGSGFGPGSDCKVLFKKDNSADAGSVERMIKNAKLPLLIVYTGVGPETYLDALPNQTFLFYHWEPWEYITPGAEIIRVNFESPVMCVADESYVALPADHACDFLEGNVHKGYSTRINSVYPEIAHLLDNYQVPSKDILQMVHAVKNGGKYQQVACKWVQKNNELWKTWLKDPREMEAWKEYVPITLMCLVGAPWR